MPAVAVRQAAVPSSCLRPGAGGWRRACGDGKGIRKAAEPGGGREVRVNAGSIQLVLPSATDLSSSLRQQHNQRI